MNNAGKGKRGPAREIEALGKLNSSKRVVLMAGSGTERFLFLVHVLPSVGFSVLSSVISNTPDARFVFLFASALHVFDDSINDILFGFEIGD